MSGVTPLLDTLLHQVLGRRAAFLRKPLLEQPIPPPQSGQPSQRAYSDSRLNARPGATTTHAAVVTGAKVRAAESAQAHAAAANNQDPATSSRLSHAARTIADILARFPAPPEALRPAAPLLQAGSAIHTTVLSALLRQSVEHSGLFYEAHLRRWHQGSYPLARLLLEPQMQPWVAKQLSMAQAGTASAQGPATRAQAGHRAGPGQGAGAMAANALSTALAAGQTAVGGPLAYGADGKPLAPLLPASANASQLAQQVSGDKLASLLTAQGQAATHGGLDATVRHQLEMLAAPMLRWEGQPWAGLFMAMALQPPPRQTPWQGSRQENDRKREDEDAWKSQITLRLARLGEVRVGLRLDSRRVALELEAAPETAARLDAGLRQLRDRLGALGFKEVELHVRAASAGEDEHA